ncbi:MAG: GAF domain-containing protein, partial [Flammeovirgaceae bacterium]
MLQRFKISTKITGLTIAIALVAILAMGFFTYHINVEAAKEKFNATISTIADNKAGNVNNYFDYIATTVNFFQQSEIISNYLQNSPDSLSKFLKQVKETYPIQEIFITDTKGAIKATTNSQTNFHDPDGTFMDKASSGLHYSTIKKADDNYMLYAGAPLHGNLLIFELNLNDLYKSLTDVNGLGNTGETFIGAQDLATQKVILGSPLRHAPKEHLKFFDEDDKVLKEITSALTTDNKSGLTTSQDYRGKKVLLAYRKIQNAPWVLLTKIDLEEIESQGANLRTIYVLTGVIILLTALGLSVLFARSLTQPLNQMRSLLDMVSKGVLPEKIEANSGDEFGQMAIKVDGLVQTLKDSAQFARLVGHGKFDAPYKPASENDMLGLALLGMRDNLVENELKEKERNWIVRGVAEVSEILRMHTSLETLGDAVLEFIITKIGAIQGAFYVVSDEDKREKLIVMQASYAYNRKKYLKKSFRFAEGLVGQAAAEKDFVMRTEIPADYVTLTSGILGDQKPNCVLIVPLITNEEVFGVVEFAGLKKFNNSQLKFVQELSVILARTIFNLKVNQRTQKLLTESQQLSAELTEKQEVLRQNAEEMRATQEELQRSNVKLEEQIEEVNRTQKRMQLLLENASEVITIYEEDGTIRYVSPSVESIFGYTAKELQG